MSNHPKLTEAIALVEKWYSTPDAKMPGYWDGLLAELEDRVMLAKRACHDCSGWANDRCATCLTPLCRWCAQGEWICQGCWVQRGIALAVTDDYL